MAEIKSFVFFDIETTGLPFQEYNQTKIIEFSFVAVLRKHLEVSSYGSMPPVRKLTFVLNPQRPVCREVTQLTGLSTKDLEKAPTFKEKLHSIISFLEDLPSPVCLVAHNGNVFDYKILLAECNDVSIYLPANIYCVDSLMGFRRILKNTNINHSNLENTAVDDLITDDEDEDEWPDLNVSTEEWEAIDIACLTLSDTENQKQKNRVNEIKNKRSAAIKKVFDKDRNAINNKECYKLTVLYKRLLNKDDENAHRAEADCLMLLQCVVAMKKDFLPWADNNCKLLTDIKPLIRGVASQQRLRCK